MPTVFVVAGLRFFFYSNEGTEPPHVHVEKGGAIGKWWLDDFREGFARGFTKSELRTIRATLKKRQADLIEAWNEHFS